MGPHNSGLVIYNLDNEKCALFSLIFLDRKISANRFIETKIKLKNNYYGIPICELESVRSFDINVDHIFSTIETALSSELKGEIDISDVIVYDTASVRNFVFEFEDLTKKWTVKDAVIDYLGEKLLVIGETVPIPSKFPIFRKINLIVTYSLPQEEILNVVVTIEGRLEE